MGESEVTLFNTPNLSVATMSQAKLKLKLDSLDYLLGGVGVLAMLTVVVPGALIVPTPQARAMLGLYLLLGLAVTVSSLGSL